MGRSTGLWRRIRLRDGNPDPKRPRRWQRRTGPGGICGGSGRIGGGNYGGGNGNIWKMWAFGPRTQLAEETRVNFFQFCKICRRGSAWAVEKERSQWQTLNGNGNLGNNIFRQFLQPGAPSRNMYGSISQPAQTKPSGSILHRQIWKWIAAYGRCNVKRLRERMASWRNL